MAKKKAATKKTTRKKSAVKKATGKKAVKKKSTKKKSTKKKAAKQKTTGKKTATKKATPRKAVKKKTSRKKVAKAKGNAVRRFELVEGSSSKFWEISQNGSEFTVRYGRIGTDGQAPKTKDMGTSEKAAAEVEKLIGAKTRKGYIETTKKQPATKKATGKRSSKMTAKKKRPAKTRPVQKSTKKPEQIFSDDDVVLTKEIAEQFLADEDSVDLSEFTSIEYAAAEGLSKHEGGLGLQGLTSLSDSAAESLSKHEGAFDVCGLYLDGLTKLSDTAAKSLSKYQGELSLDGLVSLSDSAAESLSKHSNPEFGPELRLRGLRELSDAGAEHLSTHEGLLYLNGKLKVSEVAVSFLAAHDDVQTSGVLQKRITKSARKLLANPPREKVLTVAVAKLYPKKLHGQHDLERYWMIEDAAAEMLSAASRKSGHDSLWLGSLRTLSDSVAESLSSFRGWIRLGYELTKISEHAAECLLRFKQEEYNTLDCSSEIEQQIADARRRVSRRKNSPVWPGLAKARNAGATSLRTVWEGFGDDGCFEHTFLKNGKPIKRRVDPDSDIEGLIEEKDFSVSGECNGSVGLLEIDLVTGEASFWEDDSQPLEEGRFAEFLVKCEWQHTTQLTADIKWKREGTEAKISGISSTPQNAAKLLKQDLSTLLHRLEGLEGGDEELLEDKVRRQCGMSVSLVIDVARRSFVFSGNGKRVTVKVPKNTLSVTRFQVDLGTASSKKKGKK